MQLVLDDEIRRIERPTVAERPALTWFSRPVKADAVFKAIDVSKERAGLAHPRQGRELVDRSDQKRRQTPIDRLVDGKDGQRPVAAKIAAGVGAADFEIGRRMLVRHAREGRRRERRPAPGAGLQRSRRTLVSSIAIAPHTPDRRRLVGFSSSAQLVRRCVGADPQADFDRPVAEQAAFPLIDILGVGAHELEGAHDAGSTGELVEGKEPQRVAHDDGDTGAEHPRTAQSSMSDHEGREPEVSLGLAAAGREEQQIGGLAVDVRPIDEAGQIEQHESELKRPPLRFRSMPSDRPSRPRYGDARPWRRQDS